MRRLKPYGYDERIWTVGIRGEGLKGIKKVRLSLTEKDEKTILKKEIKRLQNLINFSKKSAQDWHTKYINLYDAKS